MSEELEDILIKALLQGPTVEQLESLAKDINEVLSEYDENVDYYTKDRAEELLVIVNSVIKEKRSDA